MRSYQDFLNRKRSQYGDRFDASELSPEFVRYFESGERVKVALRYGETRFGTIGVTTGWKPVFLLMHSTRSIGSSVTLTNADRVLAVRRNGRYA